MAAPQDIAELNGHRPHGRLSAVEVAEDEAYHRGRAAYYAGKAWLRGLDPCEAEMLARDAMEGGCADPFVILLSLEPEDVAWLVAFAHCNGECREMVIGETNSWPGKPCPKHVAET